MVIVPFDPTIDLIFVKVALFGSRRSSDFNFVLDTACVTTLVTPETADRLGYSARDGEQTATVTTALGREPGYPLRVAQLFAFGLGFRCFPVNGRSRVVPAHADRRGPRGIGPAVDASRRLA